MFGLEFLFSAALFALPLAGVPVLLHLLLKQRTPTVQFSTLRFVKSSLQRTAARRKVKRWLLLALRVLLLALLVWAVAQPAKKLAGDWFGGSSSGVAAVVVDTSYSMQLRPDSTDGGGTLLDRADAAVRNLLSGPLAGARVAIFTSPPAAPDRPETLRSASDWISSWVPLRPEPATVPLVDRIGAATKFLERQGTGAKWLVVVTDGQRHEFPRTLPEWPEGVRVVWLDLHPETARDAGVTRVWIDPAQPIPGVGSEAAIEVTGRAGETRAVSLELKKPDGTALGSFGPAVATFDGGGRSVVRFPVQLPAEPWVLMRASLGGQDAIEWNNARSLLVRVPRKQQVTVVSDDGSKAPVGPTKFVTLALDPSEGTLAGWPLIVTNGTSARGTEDAVFATWTRWPDARQAEQLEAVARRGGRVVVLLHPALGSTWADLPVSQREALRKLLPAEPTPAEATGAFRLLAPAPAEPLMTGLDTAKLRFGDVVVRRMVAFGVPDPEARAVLDLASGSASTGDDEASRTVRDTRRRGVLFRKMVGAGEVYTLATLPDGRMTNLATHPLFLPLVVRIALPGENEAGTTTNAELGAMLTLGGMDVPAGASELELNSPGAQVTRVAVGVGTSGPVFTSDAASEPGVYAWSDPGKSDAPLALSNVNFPSAEADADYRPAREILPEANTAVVARSYADLTAHLSEVSEPQPRWPVFVACVLALVCVESMVGSVSQWKRRK